MAPSYMQTPAPRHRPGYHRGVPHEPRQVAAITLAAVLATGALGAAAVRVDEPERRVSAERAGFAGAPVAVEEPSAGDLAEMDRRLGTPSRVDRANRHRARRVAAVRAEERRVQ
jgi:hypothetical protein